MIDFLAGICRRLKDRAGPGVERWLKIFVTAAVLLVQAACLREKQGISWEDPSEAAAQLAAALRTEAPGDLSGWFHYPPEMSGRERENDRGNVESGLALLFREFGDVEYLELTSNPESWAEVGVGGGFLPYWNQYPEQYSATFLARFSKEGEGFAKIVLSRRRGRWVLKSVHYGLPLNRLGAAERIQYVLRLLWANPERIRTKTAQHAPTHTHG